MSCVVFYPHYSTHAYFAMLCSVFGVYAYMYLPYFFVYMCLIVVYNIFITGIVPEEDTVAAALMFTHDKDIYEMYLVSL